MQKHLLSILFYFFIVIGKTFAQAPLEFIENQGQWEGNFLFRSNTNNGDVFIRKNGLTILLADQLNRNQVHAFRHGEISKAPTLDYFSYEMNFVNSLSNIHFSNEKKQSHFYNYYLGNNSSNWKSKIHPSLVVNCTNVYNNIDLRYYSDEGHVKYDFIIHPKGNTEDIQIEYKGIDGIRLENNKLFIKTYFGEVQELAPYAYQFINGEKKEVKCNYSLKEI